MPDPGNLTNLFRVVKARVIMPEEADDYETEVTVPGDIYPGSTVEHFYFMDLELDPRFVGCLEVVPLR